MSADGPPEAEALAGPQSFGIPPSELRATGLMISLSGGPSLITTIRS